MSARLEVAAFGGFKGTSLGSEAWVTWELLSNGGWMVVEEGEGFREATRGKGGMERLAAYLDNLHPEFGQEVEEVEQDQE